MAQSVSQRHAGENCASRAQGCDLGAQGADLLSNSAPVR